MIEGIILEDGGLLLDLSQASPGIGRALVRELRLLGQRFERHLKSDLLAGRVLKARTGTGRRAIFSRVEVASDGDEITLHVGADLGQARYMRAQALGAVLRPRSGRFLAIPLAAVLTPNGVARFTAKQVREAPASFGFVRTYVAKGVIFGVRSRTRRVRGRGEVERQGDVVPLFALKASVTLPSRNYLAIAARELRDESQAALSRAAEVGVRIVAKPGTEGVSS